jgi:hypothetical protein
MAASLRRCARKHARERTLDAKLEAANSREEGKVAKRLHGGRSS